ncbi:MAG: glycosyltransferase family 4 protein [Oscillatoriales cyanobacterium RM1_1_9]|nr:glycosyltransferase family 4 protein [Oscillatoriales cyanobacterium SM2_3_0]NJO45679.1 glycosyltransferase family 4 protein [Oscillatoriales cyanobacterium RM2_1_1]NJO70527.1 glycosyltransferase family 4 protein [Oscillatoriales cyanobacterium RM1_1_9]
MFQKKVCLTAQEFPPDVGGVGESAKRIALLLKDLGFEVHVAIFRSVFRKERKLAESGKWKRSHRMTTEQNGIFVHRLYPAIRSTIARDQDYLMDVYGQLKNLHQQYQFDILHAFFINETGFVTTMLAKENNLPVINSVRGADLHKHIFDCQQQKQIAWTLENSSWATFVSQDLMKRARLFAPGVTHKSSAFWNSIAPVDFDNLPTPSLVNRLKGLVIGSVGNFRDKKGVEYLLDACQDFSSDLEFTLLFVGDFVAKEAEYWEQELKNSGLSSHIVITGQVSREEALAYLPHMDIFTIPSLNDGCPNALLEAMLAERAIVGTNVDAIGEILGNGVNGLLINPYSSTELEAALTLLIQQPLLRQRFGKAAKQLALKKLSPNVEQLNWELVYLKALQSPEPQLTPEPQLSLANIA